MRTLFDFFFKILLLPHLLVYITSKNKILINKDIERWKVAKNREGSLISSLLHFLVHSPDFRTIFYFRTRSLFTSILNLYCKKQQLFTIDIRTKINGGILTGHPYCSIINANSIGENFFINQLVTIGEIDGKRPTIGNNVSIYSGAIVIGDIHIGDNCKVGAGAVVVKNIPNNSVVVGNPARIIN